MKKKNYIVGEAQQKTKEVKLKPIKEEQKKKTTVGEARTTGCCTKRKERGHKKNPRGKISS